MKKLFGFLLFALVVAGAFGQPGAQFGFYSEGGWFMPGEVSSTSPAVKNGFALGAGIYGTAPIWGKLSVCLGAGYRYKENKGAQETDYLPYGYGHYQPYGYGGYGHSPYGYGGYGAYDPGQYYSYDPDEYYSDGDLEGDWKKFPQHYFVIPFKLKYHLLQHFFVESGITTAWSLNYKYKNEENDWLIGFGCSKYRMQWSVSYMQGLKDQGFAETTGFTEAGQVYRNRMLMLALWCPLWNN